MTTVVTSRRSARKPKGDGHLRRAEILEAAERIFVAEGYEGATIRKIADEVGVSSTALYMHFPDKSCILLEICQATIRQLLERNAEIAVKPMDDSDVGSRDAPISHQVAAHPLQECIGFACLSGLGGHPGRFVNDEDMRVLVQNAQPPLDDLAARAVRMMRDQSVGSDLQSKFLHAIAVQIDLPTPESLLGSPT